MWYPGKRNGEAHEPWSSDHEILPTGVPWADGDSLEDTQETGSTDGHAPARSENI